MSVAWSFGKSKKNNLEKTDALLSPGPGHYESHNIRGTSPAWKVGKSKRGFSTDTNQHTPGPGFYEGKTVTVNPPKYTFGQKLENQDSKLLCSPGPGNYDPKFEINNRKPSAYTMRQRPNSARDTEKTPGPGDYEIKRDLEKPSYKFGTSIRDQDSKAIKVPGPGQYEYMTGLCAEAPKYSFGKSSKILKSGQETTPGPGNYEEKRNFGNGPKISMTFTRPSSARYNQTPGPGHYESHHVRPSTPQIRFSKAKRDYDPIDSQKEKVPGPNHYAPSTNEKAKAPMISFTKSKRTPLSETENVPGPGHYTTRTNLGEGVPKFSMRIKPAILKDEVKVPGPGQYHTENLFQSRPKSPAWKIGTQKKDEGYKEIERKGVPGPGMYDTCPLEGGPSIKFGKERRKELLKSETPGPGHYKIPCSFRDVPRYISSTGNFEEQYRYI